MVCNLILCPPFFSYQRYTSNQIVVEPTMKSSQMTFKLSFTRTQCETKKRIKDIVHWMDRIPCTTYPLYGGWQSKQGHIHLCILFPNGLLFNGDDAGRRQQQKGSDQRAVLESFCQYLLTMKRNTKRSMSITLMGGLIVGLWRMYVRPVESLKPPGPYLTFLPFLLGFNSYKWNPTILLHLFKTTSDGYFSSFGQLECLHRRSWPSLIIPLWLMDGFQEFHMLTLCGKRFGKIMFGILLSAALNLMAIKIANIFCFLKSDR